VIVRLELATAFCAVLGAAQPAAAQPTAAPAEERPARADLHPALLAEAGIGDVVVYLSDDFRRSAPAAAEPLQVITIQRGNPGDALNSPADDMSGLHRYLRANSGFGAKDLVAIASSRDLIRVFFRGEHRAFAEGFKYPQATLGRAGPEHWARLRSISIPDFSRFMAKNATRQAEGERWALGPRVPKAEGRAMTFTLGIAAAGAGQSRALASALRRKRFDAVSHQVIPGPGANALEFRARLRFSEESFQRLMNGICADAASNGAECVSWSAGFEPIELTL
jgi:hypothetical protein